jgi:hypothetical protein
VAVELKRVGLPTLHNVILSGAGWSVELDHVVRVPSGIVVLETKTLGGTIAGELDSPVWTQRTAGGVEVGRLDNPVLQNQAHVRAVEGFLGDLPVPTCGYVVSAGRARFAPEIADAVVPVGDLSWVLSISFAEPNPRVLDAASQRLGRERAKSGSRRAAHEAYARRSGFGGRRNRLCAGYLQSPGGASVATRWSGGMKNCSSSGCRFDRRRARAITLALTRVSTYGEDGREFRRQAPAGRPAHLQGTPSGLQAECSQLGV